MRTSRLGSILLVLAPLAPTACRASTPDWLRAAAAGAASLPKYPEEVNAVCLLDELVVTIKDNGEIKSLHRRAYKILRPQGREYGVVFVPFDTETKLTILKAWSIPADGKDYEVKEKDAVEISLSGEELYVDVRAKVLRIPAAEPGNVLGYEYQQKERPSLLQNTWWFQAEHPVREARFTLQLPSGWEHKAYWVNYSELAPTALPNHGWQWKLTDVPLVKKEPSMPPPQAVEGRLVVLYSPQGDRQRTIGSWDDFGKWFNGIAAGRREVTPEIRQKVTELTAGAATRLDKIRALVGFVQRDIRYVAIEIDIGGYQPHPAQEVFAKRYGDCKDKATLLSAMLLEIGVDSYYVIIHSRRGVNNPNTPPGRSFNHAILAIRLPEDVSTANLYAVRQHSKLGRLLFFDPSDSMTPLGYLPASLQANYGLLVTAQGGQLVELPLLPPATNRLLRVAKLSLTPTGTLSGEVQEVRWGEPAVSRRAELLQTQPSERMHVLEGFLASFLSGFSLMRANVTNLDKYDESLVLNYRFVAESYAKTAGNLLLCGHGCWGKRAATCSKSKNEPIRSN